MAHANRLLKGAKIGPGSMIRRGRVREAIAGVAIAGLLSVCLIFLSACSAEKDDVIAGIDDLHVTEIQYLNALKRYYRQTGQAVNLSRDVKETVLENQLNRYAGVKFAQDRGWDRDEEALFQRALIERQVLIEEYQRRMIHDEVYVTDEDLRELFVRFNTKLRASHLYAPSRTEADSLYRLVTNGADFASVARQVFRSPELVRSGGDLGFFTVDEMDVAFEDVAFRMETGDVSEPVRTNTGFSIIKVTDRITRPIITENEYANARARIYPLAVDQKKELATRADIEEKVEQFNIPESLIRQLWDVVRHTGQEVESGYLMLGPLPAGYRSMGFELLVDQPEFRFTVNDFLNEAFYTPLGEWGKIERYQQFRDFLEGTVYRSFAIRTIESSDRLDRDFVDGAISETFYSYLYRRFDQHVERSVEITPQEIAGEYAENRSYFAAPVALNLSELGTDNWHDAEAAMDALDRGVDFRTVFERYAVDDPLKSRNGELGFIDIDQFGTLSVPLAEIQPGEVKGPFQIQDNRIVIFKCLDRRESRALSLEEAEPRVRDYLIHTRKEELRTSLLNYIKEKYEAFMKLDKIDQLTLEF